MRIRLTALALSALVCFAQETTPPPEPAPPPEVDKALRARVDQFFQAHVDGKFRVADQVVAEDSKDAFFAAPKQKYLEYHIIRINYKDNFQKAEAVVSCLGDWTVRGQRLKVNMVSTSLWKVIDGQWFWYAPPPGPVQSPFGTMHAGPGSGQTGTETGKAPPMVPPDPQAAAMAILHSVKIDKDELMLSSYEKVTGEVKITNGLQGSITLRADIDSVFPGLSYSLDKTELNAGEVATLRIVCEPKDRVPKPTLTARIYVDPTNQVLPVKLMFAVPPEIEKQIPKELRIKPVEMPKQQ